TTDTTTSPAPATAASVSAPILSSDRFDYNPGSTAIISGNFFPVAQWVALKIFGGSQSDGTYTESNVQVMPDNTGLFTYNYQLDDVARPLYTVVANSTIDGTQLATLTFTDSNPATDI